jgi:hypothetical protein
VTVAPGTYSCGATGTFTVSSPDASNTPITKYLEVTNCG